MGLVRRDCLRFERLLLYAFKEATVIRLEFFAAVFKVPLLRNVTMVLMETFSSCAAFSSVTVDRLVKPFHR